MAEKGLRERKIMGGGGLGGKENRERESYEKMGKRLRGESGFWGGRGPKHRAHIQPSGCLNHLITLNLKLYINV